MSTWKTLNTCQWPKIAQFWLLPPVCVLCQQPGLPQLDLCPACQGTFTRPAHCCPGCALPLPTGAQGFRCGRCLQGTRIHTTVTAARYEEPVSTLITRFKYHQHLAAGEILQIISRIPKGRRFRKMHESFTLAANATGMSVRIVNTQDIFRGALVQIGRAHV